MISCSTDSIVLNGIVYPMYTIVRRTNKNNNNNCPRRMIMIKCIDYRMKMSGEIDSACIKPAMQLYITDGHWRK